jgi:tol-pal system protein YbgF
MQARQSRFGIRMCLGAIGTVLLSGCMTTPEQDPTVQKLTELDGRLLRIERVMTNQSLLDQSQRVDSIQNELRAIRGSIEEMQHNLTTTQKQQREMYEDLNKRMQALEGNPSAAGPTASVAGPVAGGAAAAQDDRAAYQAAFELLKDGKYADAIQALKRFQTTYPTSQLLDNAQYWLGEAYYVTKDYPSSLAAFKQVVEKYPESRKVPDALLKIGYCEYELKNWSQAKTALNRVTREFGDTSSAKLAAQRLAKIESEGH